MKTPPARSEPDSAALARMDTLQALDHLTETPLALGAAGLRHSYKRFLLTALIAAVVLHIAGFGSFKLVSLWGEEVVVEAPPLEWVEYEELAAPPLTPEAPADAATPPPAPAPPPDAGTPTPVPDERASPKTTILPDNTPAPSEGEQANRIGVIPGAGSVRRVVPPQPPPLPPQPTPSTPGDPGEEPPEFRPVEVMAVAVSRPQPEYPEFARRAGITGRVTVKAWVTAEGTVREVRLLRGAHPLLDEAAVEAVRRWTFSPAQQNNRAVAVWVSVPITFSLN